MQAQDIQDLLSREMAGAQVSVEGEAGKFMVRVVSDAFEGLNAVKRQQAVYRVLNPHISSGVIHAVSMDLSTPGEAGA